MNRKISVLQLGSPTGLYGAERWILALTKYLPRHIRSVVGVIRDEPDNGDSALCEEAKQQGLETCEISALGRFNGAAVSGLRQFIEANQIDILHTHWYKTDIIGRLAVRGTSCKIVTTPHGWSANAGPVLQVYELLDRLFFPFMDAVVPLSPQLYQELKRWPGVPRKLHFIRNGVDLSEVDQEIAVNPTPLDQPSADSFRIGYIGQLIPRKGVDTLIRAFSHLAVDNSRLMLVGDGPQRDELERLVASIGIGDRVEFLGFRDDRIRLLSQFDVFVLPSLLEGIPRCLMEAMSASKAVVATEIPGCTDIVRDGSSGILFPPGDVNRLANILRELYLKPGYRQSLGAEANRLVRNDYSAKRMAGEYAQLFTSLLTEKVTARRDG